MVKRKKGGNAASAARSAGGGGRSARAKVDAAEADEPDVLSESGASDDGEVVGPVASDGEDAFFETPDEKRVRLAKEYLAKLGEGRPREEVSEHLAHSIEDHNKRTRVQVADLTLGDPRLLKGHKRATTCVCLSSDENSVYSGGKDCHLLRYDVETGKRDLFPGGRNRFACGGHFDQVLSCCLVEQRSLLVSVGVDRVVRLWDWRAPARTHCSAALLGHQGAITAVAAEPDGTQVYSASMDLSLRMWDLRTRRCADTLLGHVAGVSALDVYAKGRALTGGVDKTVRLWKVEKDTHLMFNRHTYPVDAVCVVDQDRFVSGSQDGSMMLWTHSSKKPLATTRLGARQWVTALSAVRRGDVVFSGSIEGMLCAWRLAKAGGGADSKGYEFVPALATVQAPGCINQIAVGRRVLACAVGKEQKLGRWFHSKPMKNGVLIVPFSYHEN